jgi:hypothetical protein
VESKNNMEGLWSLMNFIEPEKYVRIVATLFSAICAGLNPLG